MDDPEEWSPTAAKNLIKMAEWTIAMTWRSESPSIDDYVPGQQTSPGQNDDEWQSPMPMPYAKVRFNTRAGHFEIQRVYSDGLDNFIKPFYSGWREGVELFLQQVWRSQIGDFGDLNRWKSRSQTLIRYINSPGEWKFPYPYPYE